MKSKNDELIKVEVSLHAESEKSWAVLVDIHSPTSASRKEWFPKSLCSLEKHPTNIHRYFLTAPEWLLAEKNVKFHKNERLEKRNQIPTQGSINSEYKN